MAMLTQEQIDMLRESARGAIREAGLSTAYSDGTERGAPAALGKYPPNTSYQEGGETETPADKGNQGTTTGEMRGAAQAAGVKPFSSGKPAPSDFPSFTPPDLSDNEHVSDGKQTPHRTDGGDHVTTGATDGGTVMAPMDMGNPKMVRGHTVPLSHSFPGVALLEAVGYTSGIQRCATCSHLRGHHPPAFNGGMCTHCGPKGSIHKFSETVDMTPQLMTVPLHAANPVDSGDVYLSGKSTGSSLTESTWYLSLPEAHRRMFSETEKALIRLDEIHEALLPWRGKSDIDEGGDVRKEQMDAARDRAETYNRHTVAAHRQTLAAYMSGNHSEHHVAEGHHKLASDAAEAAAGDYPDNHPAKRDYKIAAGYHKQQMQAHHHAANAAHRGAVPGRHEIAIDAPFRY